MPDFTIFGAFSLVLVALWMEKENYRKRLDVWQQHLFNTMDLTTQALRLLNETIDMTAGILRNSK